MRGGNYHPIHILLEFPPNRVIIIITVNVSESLHAVIIMYRAINLYKNNTHTRPPKHSFTQLTYILLCVCAHAHNKRTIGEGGVLFYSKAILRVVTSSLFLFFFDYFIRIKESSIIRSYLYSSVYGNL